MPLIFSIIAYLTAAAMVAIALLTEGHDIELIVLAGILIVLGEIWRLTR